MTCEEIPRLIDPYLDGELDLSTCVAVEKHSASCAACRDKMEARQQLLTTIREETPRFETPPFLSTRIQAALRSETAAKTPFWLKIPAAWIYSAIGGAVAVAVLAVLIQSSEGPFAQIAREGVSNHVRSLQLNHLMDVASTDQHTVKPWFAGKVDFSPQVVDLAPSGFPLVGGRLDVLDQHDVAALIYKRRQHYVNLFIWPVREGSVGDQLYAKDGYRAMSWTKWGMNYLAVSELSENELRDFANLIKDQAAPPIE